MKIADCECNLCGVKLCLGFREAFLFRKVLEELTSLDELHDEVNSVSFLEHVVHAYDEWVIDLIQN